MKKEIRLHGRGGQGAKMAASILASAFVAEDKYAASFPMFGFERRGAPVTSFVRFSDQAVREKTQIYHPDCIIAIDSSHYKSPTIYEGLRPGGILVLNSSGPITEKPHVNLDKVGTVDATMIAFEEMGAPIANSCMLGSFACITGWVSLGSVIDALAQFFDGEALRKNRRTVERGFGETKISGFENNRNRL